MTDSRQEMTPSAAPQEPDSWSPVLVYPLGTFGALVGAALGVWVMTLGLQSGMYVEALIGVFAGLGAGFLGRHGGWPMGIIAGLVTLVVGVWAEWKFGWRFQDSSLGYFIGHFAELPTIRLVIHVAGVGMAVWFGARK